MLRKGSLSEDKKEASMPALQMGDKLPVQRPLQRCQGTVWVTGGGGRCDMRGLMGHCEDPGF